MISVLRRCSGLALLLTISAVACDAETTDPSQQQPETMLSVYLTDAPGDVEAVWVDISEIYFQGGPGGRFTILSEPTGLVELTSLQDRAVELVGDLEVEPGNYAQLRFILASAVLEATDGSVYVFGDAEHPTLPTTGELKCPGCSNSGLKVNLNGDAVAMDEGVNALVLDFDVAQSFGRPAGQSGKWIMKPVIHGVKATDGEDPEMPGAGATIAGTVRLGTDAEGAPITLPQCPEGTDRGLDDFVPTAVAINLVDDLGEVIVRTGEVNDEGLFSIDFLEADEYTLSWVPFVELGELRLAFEASVTPDGVDVADGLDVDGVEYVITAARCEANTTGG